MSYSYSLRTRPFKQPYGQKRNNNRNTSNRKRYGKYIDPARFVASAKPTNEEVYVPTHKFGDFPLETVLQENLRRKGYVTPSPIQDQTIPAGLAGQDIIGMAGTGTGKTAAFALPVLNKILRNRQNAAIIIAPTRELAQQIKVEFEALGANTKLKYALLIGGSSMGYQLRDLRNRPQIVIGTPGRIKDHLQRGTLKLNAFNLVVLDEVDRMLDMGFVNDVREILSHTNQEKQTFFFSATMDQRVSGLVSGFTKDPITVSLQSNKASENVHQDVVRYQDNNHRLDELHNLLNQDVVEKVIVFDDTQRGVERLQQTLLDRGFKVESLHGGKSQGQRQRALRKFKQNEVSVLVATDVAARGIDIADITHVINYSVPKEYDDYIHRIGRAGRAGQVGYAYTFVAK